MQCPRVGMAQGQRGQRRATHARRATTLGCLLGLLAASVAPAEARSRWRGWDWLVEKLIAEGVDAQEVKAVFSDPRLPPFEGMSFSPAPVESAWRYRLILRPETVRLARRCLAAHRTVLDRVERQTSIPASLLASLLTVETRCGQNFGREVIFYRLARLAMANEPGNLAENAARLCGEECSPDLESQVRSRARYLENTFFPEVKACFSVARQLGVPVLELRGSSAGAFGWAQFLPTSYLRFGRDGNGDGRVDLFQIEDAALSAAEYLRAHGWHRRATSAEKRAALWAYNRSTAYGEAVLALAERLRQSREVMPRAPKSKTTSARAEATGR